MSKPAKLGILFLSLFPFIYMAFFVAGIAYTFNAVPNEGPIVKHFGIFLAVHGLVMLLMLGMLAFYIVFLFKTSAIKNDLKALWAVVLLFGGPVAMPIFWYLYIWQPGQSR